jgi:hypothetical protein
MNLLRTAVQQASWYDWIWVAYLLSVLVVFGALEWLALHLGHDTLSAFVWRVSRAWPPFGWLIGVVVGFLAAHFWWPNEGL